ncbi:uncharacterized protein LOC142330068 [Lycorma delicatula]|uniref:uncharacterized protein LOC142330068 n=1 Tax=Lycorma delicatula TaxID=130591 RepID=UPI003F51327F
MLHIPMNYIQSLYGGYSRPAEHNTKLQPTTSQKLDGEHIYNAKEINTNQKINDNSIKKGTTANKLISNSSTEDVTFVPNNNKYYNNNNNPTFTKIDDSITTTPATVSNSDKNVTSLLPYSQLTSRPNIEKQESSTISSTKPSYAFSTSQSSVAPNSDTMSSNTSNQTTKNNHTSTPSDENLSHKQSNPTKTSEDPKADDGNSITEVLNYPSQKTRSDGFDYDSGLEDTTENSDDIDQNTNNNTVANTEISTSLPAVYQSEKNKTPLPTLSLPNTKAYNKSKEILDKDPHNNSLTNAVAESNKPEEIKTEKTNEGKKIGIQIKKSSEASTTENLKFDNEQSTSNPYKITTNQNNKIKLEANGSSIIYCPGHRWFNANISSGELEYYEQK